jgi:hypothetical protein
VGDLAKGKEDLFIMQADQDMWGGSVCEECPLLLADCAAQLAGEPPSPPTLLSVGGQR